MLSGNLVRKVVCETVQRATGLWEFVKAHFMQLARKNYPLDLHPSVPRRSCSLCHWIPAERISFPCTVNLGVYIFFLCLTFRHLSEWFTDLFFYSIVNFICIRSISLSYLAIFFRLQPRCCQRGGVRKSRHNTLEQRICWQSEVAPCPSNLIYGLNFNQCIGYLFFFFFLLADHMEVNI